MTAVHYFARYTQRENFITNNTLLLFYRLYDESRRRFQSFLTLLLDAQADQPITNLGLQINEQIGTGASVLDGDLHQTAFRIAIETKPNAELFYADQLIRHLKGFNQGSSGYLMLLSPKKLSLEGDQWKELHEHARHLGVIVASVSFEDVIRSVRECLRPHDENMHTLLDDYEAFCSENQLLDTDERTLFVPPCSQSIESNAKFKTYFCPSHWSRRNTKYIGFYAAKSVQHIGIVSKVVCWDLDDKGCDIFTDQEGEPLDLHPEEISRIKNISDEVKSKNGWDLGPGHKFYMCDRMVDSDFKKNSSGGIMGHRYLYIPKYLNSVPSNLEELGKRLSEKSWE